MWGTGENRGNGVRSLAALSPFPPFPPVKKLGAGLDPTFQLAWQGAPSQSSAMHNPCRLLAFVLLLFPGALLRSQVTETPFTIAPGHFELRVDALTLGFDQENTTPKRYTALGVAHSLFQIGLTKSTDLQVGAQLFKRQTYQTSTGRTSDSGFGDVNFRVKYSFWRDPAAGAAAAGSRWSRSPRSNSRCHSWVLLRPSSCWSGWRALASRSPSTISARATRR